MTAPVVVIVSGTPGSGKTTLARALQQRLALPLIAKDDVKERLGDSLGTGDIVWSRKLGSATWDILFLLYERLLEGRTSFIAESNFSYVPHHEAFEELRARLPFVPFEVHCFTDAATLASRFRARQVGGGRHPVHHGAGFEAAATPEGVEAVFADRRHIPLDLSEYIVRVDTGAAQPVDLDGIVASIREVADGL